MILSIDTSTHTVPAYTHAWLVTCGRQECGQILTDARAHIITTHYTYSYIAPDMHWFTHAFVYGYCLKV